jgi:tetratricopeptide (TPR) repeat protein
MTAGQIGNFDEMEDLQEKALAIQLQTNYVVGQATSNMYLGSFKLLRGSLEEARAQVQLALDQSLEIADFSTQAWCYAIFSWLKVVRGDYQDAAADLERAEHIATDPFRQTGGGNPFLQLIMNLDKSLLDIVEGNIIAARQHLLQPLKLSIMTSSQIFMSMVPALLALIAYHDGRAQRSAELLGLAFSAPDFVSGWLHQTEPLSQLQSELLQRLGPDEFEACWTRGQALDLLETSKEALKDIEATIVEPS